jgi:hypothetical protein
MKIFGPDVMRQYVEQIDLIAQGSPEVARDILSALWQWDEDRDETTSLTQGIINLTSTLKQDVDQVKWQSGEKFAAFVSAVGLREALRVVAMAVRLPDDYSNVPTRPLEAYGATGCLIAAASSLSHGPGHGAASKIVDAFLTALFADESDEADRIELVRDMVVSIGHREYWRRLLLRAADSPGWWLPVARVLASGALIFDADTRAAAGALIRVLSPTLKPRDHAEFIEAPIRHAARMFSPDAHEWRDLMVDQLLGCLDASHVQDEEFHRRLVGLLEAQELNPIPGPRRVEVRSERLSLREVIGNEAYAAIDEDARDSLNELRLALEDFRSAEPLTVHRLSELFARLVPETRGESKPVLELLTRAAERLAHVASVEPGNELGELVVGFLLHTAGGDVEATQ